LSGGSFRSFSSTACSTVMRTPTCRMAGTKDELAFGQASEPGTACQRKRSAGSPTWEPPRSGCKPVVAGGGAALSEPGA
jgi:hypothetical protein